MRVNAMKKRLDLLETGIKSKDQRFRISDDEYDGDYDNNMVGGYCKRIFYPGYCKVVPEAQKFYQDGDMLIHIVRHDDISLCHREPKPLTGMDSEAIADHTANVATTAPEPPAPGQHVPVEEPNPAPVPMKDPDPSPAPMKNPEPPAPSRRSSGHRASMKG
jgi:hypothetical protein